MSGETRQLQQKTVIILHNIRSIHNVGSIFRTADAAGVSKIYLTGYTPAPIDRFGRPRKDLAKVSLGAEKSVEWEACPQILPLLKRLKKIGVKIISVEQDGKSVDYLKLKLPPRLAFIFGNEVEGVSPEILKESDLICEIPMFGAKESLNVSVTAGIILFSARS